MRYRKVPEIYSPPVRVGVANTNFIIILLGIIIIIIVNATSTYTMYIKKQLYKLLVSVSSLHRIFKTHYRPKCS